MQNKKIASVLAVVAVLVGGFYALNGYIYKEKQADFVVGDTVAKSGKVLSVNMDQAAFDGPYLLTLESADESLYTIALPSMGLSFCPAYKNKNIGDVSLIKIGEMIEVNGTLGGDGSIVPCESPDHYLRTKPIVVEDFEGEADPSRMTLTMKTWNWISALYNDERAVKPKQAGKFTLTFKNDGTFSATTDCNGVGGKYTTKPGSQIAFSEMMSTKMYCEGSDEVEFNQLLTNTSGYHFTSKGELILDLKYDSGSVVFR
ncbi:MAG: hypothetical protein AB200_00495 [Parcubacteria bacterium C7867-005]|nr:MAG: hypothetical protein AB200_00495 [Parcubacteria bacterium C7867-005]